MSKTDRLARLYRVEQLLYQNPRGLTLDEIAQDCKVSTRTTRRDLDALQSWVEVAIYDERGKWYLLEGRHLPPIRFSLPEAMTVFLAARLMLNYSRRYDPNIESTFFKLNCIVPSPLKEQVRKTMDWLEKQVLDKDHIGTMATLAEAWGNQHTVKIVYQALGDEEAAERSVDPYFIEPAAAGHASYLIGYCHRTMETRTFKIERIKAIEITPETYQIPADFDANAYLASSWGIVAGGEVATVRLRFSPELARIMEETVWHPSQRLEPQRDGSVIVTFRVTDTVELYSWIMGWGEKVEVLEPEELRQHVVATAEAMLDVYRQG